MVPNGDDDYGSERPIGIRLPTGTNQPHGAQEIVDAAQFWREQYAPGQAGYYRRYNHRRYKNVALKHTAKNNPETVAPEVLAVLDELGVEVKY